MRIRQRCQLGLVALGTALACASGGESRGEPPAPSPAPEAYALSLLEDPPPNSLPGWWKRLLERGCAVEARRHPHDDVPWPPMVARAVRNTPYALRGRVFEDQDLAALFSGQDWYRPRPDAPLPPESEVRCARELLAWEQQQRGARTIPSRAFEARLTAGGFVSLYVSSPDAFWIEGGEEFTSGGTTWWCRRAAEPPIEGYPCEGASIFCRPDGRCTAAPGP